MTDLIRSETFSLEELEAETCLALPERDLLQNVVVGVQSQANCAGSSCVAASIGLLITTAAG
jgi:hypothetical protein